MARRKREEIEEEVEVQGSSLLSALALLTLAVLTIAIFYNAMLAQPGGRRLLANGGATRLEVHSPGGQTIQLKYDPTVEEVQRQLLAAGLYKGMVDGVVGRRTKEAIEAYQKAQGLEVTGQPTSALAEHIRYTREIAEASLFTGTIKPAPDAEQRARIRRIQSGLLDLAYDPGDISGEMTEETRSAIEQFERDRNLPVTGEISDELLAELDKPPELTTPQN